MPESMMQSVTAPIVPCASLVAIEGRILCIRSQRVIIDADLASLYGVPTKRLNEQVKRNADRFPSDFMFSLSTEEKAEVVANCDHLSKLKYAKALPFVFTEHGAIQAANVLGSPQAIQMGVYVVRTFVRLRQMLVSDEAAAKRFNELEAQLAALLTGQENFEGKTERQFQQIFEILRGLTTQPQSRKRPIGFILPDK